jgi:hypothetical protein
MFLSRDRLETTLLTSSERGSVYTRLFACQTALIASLGEVRMPGAWIKETHSPLQPKLPLSVGGSLCKLLWARGHLWPSVRKFYCQSVCSTGGFLTPVGGKSTPACSGCQGNITTYCIPCRDGPNGLYDFSTSTGNSHACKNLLSAGLAAQGFG